MAEGKKLLIIDDDPDFVEGILSILTNAGYEVDTAYNPKSIFIQLKNYRT